MLDRKAGKHVVRYRLTVDAGVNPETGRRQQVRRHCTSERLARAAPSNCGFDVAQAVSGGRCGYTLQRGRAAQTHDGPPPFSPLRCIRRTGRETGLLYSHSGRLGGSTNRPIAIPLSRKRWVVENQATRRPVPLAQVECPSRLS